MLLGAVGAFGLAVSALAVDRPLARCEAAVFGAAVIGLVAPPVAAGGEMLLAIANRDSPATPVTTAIWLQATNRVAFTGALRST